MNTIHCTIPRRAAIVLNLDAAVRGARADRIPDMMLEHTPVDTTRGPVEVVASPSMAQYQRGPCGR